MFIYLYLVYYYLVFGCFSSVCSMHSHSVSFVVVVYCCCVLKSHHDKNAHDFSFSPELHLALISIEKKHHRKMSIEAPQFLTIFNPQLEMSTKGLNLVQSFRTCVCVLCYSPNVCLNLVLNLSLEKRISPFVSAHYSTIIAHVL